MRDLPPPLLERLSPAARAALLHRAVERRYASREKLFCAGDAAHGLFVVCEGRVRVVQGRGDRRHVVHTEGPGGTLGEVPLFAGGAYPATAVAAEPTRCLLLSRAALEAAIATHPELAFLLLGRLASRVRELVARLEERTTQDISARLAAYLLERPRLRDGRTVSLGMTQSELAEELGTVRELVVRALRRFRERDLVHARGGNRFELRDEAGLRALI